MLPPRPFCVVRKSVQSLELTLASATSGDLPFILSRAKLFSNTQGFLPASWIETFVAERRVLIARINGQEAGYMITTGGVRKPLVLRHNTVERELWSQGIGTALVKSLLEWTALWSPHPVIEVRTRRLILPQEVINARVGGLVYSTERMIGVRGQPVDTWRVPLAEVSRERETAAVECPGR